MSKVVVLNTDMTILTTTTWEEAICMIVRNRAESIVDSEELIHHSKIYKPLVIRILNTVRHLWRKSVPFSNKNIHTRDKYTCQYCNTALAKAQATIDHVIPRSKGGKNKWTNCVCSCFSCNNKKGDRLPSEAKMFLKKQPRQPTIMEFIVTKVKNEGLESLLKDLEYFN